MRHNLLAIVCIAASIIIPASPVRGEPTTVLTGVPDGTYEMQESHTRILFGVPHLGLSTYWAQMVRVEGTLRFKPSQPEESRLSVTVDAASVVTGDPGFDTMLQGADWLDATAHPAITFVSRRIERTGETTGKVIGDFTLRGVTKEITLDVTFNGSMMHPFANARALGFSATGTIKRSDFGMDSLILFGIGDDVRLVLEAEFIHEE